MKPLLKTMLTLGSLFMLTFVVGRLLGILTVENRDQAWTRATLHDGPGEKDKGGFAARAALTMLEIRKTLGNPK